MRDSLKDEEVKTNETHTKYRLGKVAARNVILESSRYFLDPQTEYSYIVLIKESHLECCLVSDRFAILFS